MDIKTLFAYLISSFIIFARTLTGLLINPYKTVRTQSISGTFSHGIILCFMSLFYFTLAKPTISEIVLATVSTLILYTLTIIGFSILPGDGTLYDRLKRYAATWVLSYVPTLIWFYASFYLFLLFPPPRTESMQGVALSVLFLAFSLSLLAWKGILVYLSIRFSSRVQLYRVLYYVFLYLAVSIPVWILLYNLHIFRVPFV